LKGYSAKSGGGYGPISGHALIVVSRSFSATMMTVFLFSGFPGCLFLLPPPLALLAALVVAAGLLVVWPVGWVINKLRGRH